MENYILLHPVDFHRLTQEHPEEYKVYCQSVGKLPYVEIEGIPLCLYRSFNLNNVLHIECRVKVNGEFLVKEKQPVTKPVPLSFDALLDLLKSHIVMSSDAPITEIAIHASIRGVCTIGIDRYSFRDETYNTEMTYLVKGVK